MRHFNWRYASVFAAIGLVTGAAVETQAAGFQLRETSANKIGYASAGSATESGDAAAQYDNPATMMTLNKHAVAASAIAVLPSVKYTNITATSITGNALTNNGGADDGAKAAVVPAAFLVWHINNNWRAGLGITVPFGLETDYKKNWAGRLFGTHSKLETIDVNPSVAFRVNDKISLGAGFSVQYAKATLGRALDSAVLGTVPEVELTGNNVAWGGNVGVLFTPWCHTRFGLSYRSQIRHDISGDFKVKNRASAVIGAGLVDSTKARTSVTLPETVVFSAHHDVTAKWNIRSDVQWTHWKRLRSIKVNLNSGPTPTSEEILNLKNAWFFSVGTGYKVLDNLLLTAGVAYDQGNTDDTYRSPRIPDNNRTWFTLGGKYDFSENFSTSLSYAYIKVANAKINMRGSTITGSNTFAGQRFIANSKADVHLIGLKAQWKF